MSNIKPLDLNLVVKGEEISVKYLFDLDKFSIQIMYSYLSRGQLYEADLSYFLMNILGKGDTFLDVGAHIGFFSVIAAKLVGPKGRVVAFEPEEDNLQSLKSTSRSTVLPTSRSSTRWCATRTARALFTSTATTTAGIACGTSASIPSTRKAPPTPCP